MVANHYTLPESSKLINTHLWLRLRPFTQHTSSSLCSRGSVIAPYQWKILSDLSEQGPNRICYEIRYFTKLCLPHYPLADSPTIHPHSVSANHSPRLIHSTSPHPPHTHTKKNLSLALQSAGSQWELESSLSEPILRCNYVIFSIQARPVTTWDASPALPLPQPAPLTNTNAHEHVIQLPPVTTHNRIISAPSLLQHTNVKSDRVANRMNEWWESWHTKKYSGT